jgi:hypothetical protein
MYLQPERTKEFTGKIYYHSNSQAWCLIRLNKEITNELKHLKEKRGDFSYEMIMPIFLQNLEKEIEKIKKENKVIPILLWIKKKEEFKKSC